MKVKRKIHRHKNDSFNGRFSTYSLWTRNIGFAFFGKRPRDIDPDDWEDILHCSASSDSRNHIYFWENNRKNLTTSYKNGGKYLIKHFLKHNNDDK